jgi:phenylacetate-coenzyme A ligase PaaK-like adenylate-forming protein
MLPESHRKRINVEKIVYTSEPLTSPQRVFIQNILSGVKIYSFMGSSEAGPWAISSPDLTGEHSLTDSSTDFVFDTRSMLIEIIPLSDADDASQPDLNVMSPGKPGRIVQTSLQRLRNPLVRYDTGDIGSLHSLPEMASAVVPEADRKHLLVLRMHGRDHRFSFKWYAAYFEFDKIELFMQTEEFGILQWQIILGRFKSSPQSTLEIRILRRPQDGVISDEDLKHRIGTFFLVLPENQHLAQIVFVNDLEGFERSLTARKVIKFVDRWNH